MFISEIYLFPGDFLSEFVSKNYENTVKRAIKIV